jgi:integrase
LYLTAEELKRFLDHVRQAARHPFIYPMICMAAHTGARRSELIRAEISDVDFAADQIQIREKKRVRGQVTFRRVPLTPHLRSVLESWLARIFHQLVFCTHIKEYLYVLCRFSPISLFLRRIPLTPS